MSVSTGLTALGFDIPRLRYGFRTAVAACLALVVAWALNLEHPQWAAMTVWAASQPVRGMLIEKSLFRAAGTAIGVVAGLLLMLVANGNATTLVIGLALWVGLCAGIGNILRGFVSYGAILAGFSAAMVTLLSTAHHDSILMLGIDRLATVLVGVGVALIGGLIFTPPSKGDYDEAVSRLTGRLLDEMARPAAERSLEEQRAILSEAAALEEALDPHAAGSLNARRAAHAVRALLLALVSGLLWLRGAEASRMDPATREKVGDGAAIDDPAYPELGTVLRSISTGVDGLDNRPLNESDERLPVVLHRDWQGARTAMVRATATMFLIGLVWILTGWDAMPYVLLGTSVMISVFSTFDDPAGILKAVFLGQLFGALAALICRWLFWPLAGSEFELMLFMVPFILSGALVLSNRRSVNAGPDYALVFLLLMQPVLPLSGTFWSWVATAAAVVAGPVIALAAFKLIYPVDPRRRLNMLVAAMVHDLERMAASDRPVEGERWRMRLNHRLLRLVRWVEKTGDRKVVAFEGSFAVLALGSAIVHMQQLLVSGTLSPRQARAVKAALARAARVAAAPEAAGQALERAARQLDGDALVADAARQVLAQSAFFRRGATA